MLLISTSHFLTLTFLLHAYLLLTAAQDNRVECHANVVSFHDSRDCEQAINAIPTDIQKASHYVVPAVFRFRKCVVIVNIIHSDSSEPRTTTLGVWTNVRSWAKTIMETCRFSDSSKAAGFVTAAGFEPGHRPFRYSVAVVGWPRNRRFTESTLVGSEKVQVYSSERREHARAELAVEHFAKHPFPNTAATDVRYIQNRIAALSAPHTLENPNLAAAPNFVPVPVPVRDHQWQLSKESSNDVKPSILPTHQTVPHSQGLGIHYQGEDFYVPQPDSPHQGKR